MSNFLKCGSPPKDLGYFDLRTKEMMIYLYLPIHMYGVTEIPERLDFIRPLITAISQEHVACGIIKKYIYVTVKSMIVTEGYAGNRMGWHVDGFSSNGDLNYIWYNMNPTEFAVQEFIEVSRDDKQSMIDMTNQAKAENIITYDCKHLLRLDEEVVHRVSPKSEHGWRTFIKITASDHKFINEGNSKNYLFAYSWQMKSRIDGRNIDHE